MSKLTQEEVQSLICVIKNADKYASAGFSINVSGCSEELGTIQFSATSSAAAKISKRQKGYWSKVKRVASKNNISVAQARKIISEEKKKKSA